MRLILTVALAAFTSVGGLGAAAPEFAAVPLVSAPTCSEQTSAASCDSDSDRVTDVLEKQVCGTATCATGREDRDHDGVADWSEILVCGTATCADPGTDTDGDGVPDFAEIYVCGSVSCSTAREDADADKIADWVEFVICGDRTCANGGEDYDADGISDAKQLSACVVAYDVTGPGLWLTPAVSGFTDAKGVQVTYELLWWPLIVGAILGLAGLTFFWVAFARQRRRDRARADGEADGADVDEFLGLNA